MVLSKKPYFVYFLECADKSIYIGITTDVARRFGEHKNSIGSRYTRSHRAKKILYSEEYRSRSDALKREAEIKRWPREKKLKLISSSLHVQDVRAARGHADATGDRSLSRQNR